MEARDVMKKSIRHVVQDLDRIGAIVRKTEQQLDFCKSAPDQEKLHVIKEELGEVHARLDGVREFVLSCQRRAVMSEPPEEEVDIWL